MIYKKWTNLALQQERYTIDMTVRTCKVHRSVATVVPRVETSTSNQIKQIKSNDQIELILLKNFTNYIVT